MFPTLQLGPLAFPVGALAILLGLWIGLWLSERHAPRFALAGEMLYNLALVGFIAGVIGARLVYLLRYPAAFLATPANIVSLNPGLLDPVGGMIVGGLAALVYGQRKNLPLWPTLDSLTSGLAILAIGVGVAHLANGDAFGAPTALPWAVRLWGAERHPTQIYEILAAVLVLWLTWPRKSAQPSAAGVRFLYFIAWSAAARLFLEAFRGDSLLLTGGIRSAQVVAWLILGVSLWGIWAKMKSSTVTIQEE